MYEHNFKTIYDYETIEEKLKIVEKSVWDNAV
jgi:hypothetical protein